MKSIQLSEEAASEENSSQAKEQERKTDLRPHLWKAGSVLTTKPDFYIGNLAGVSHPSIGYVNYSNSNPKRSPKLNN